MYFSSRHMSLINHLQDVIEFRKIRRSAMIQVGDHGNQEVDVNDMEPVSNLLTRVAEQLKLSPAAVKHFALSAALQDGRGMHYVILTSLNRYIAVIWLKDDVSLYEQGVTSKDKLSFKARFPLGITSFDDEICLDLVYNQVTSLTSHMSSKVRV
jgi:hypothetical protein